MQTVDFSPYKYAPDLLTVFTILTRLLPTTPDHLPPSFFHLLSLTGFPCSLAWSDPSCALLASSWINGSRERSRKQAEATTSVSLLDLDSSDMARILLLFSGHHHHTHYGVAGPSSPERVFECKTCNRQFPSFQALGGHRASHKKPRLPDGAEPPKPKVHGCSICGLQFAVGQALGGHMRRHRAVAAPGEGLALGLGLSLGRGPRDVGEKKTTATTELVLDLNVPAPLEEDPADRANKQLRLTVDFPVVVDFRR